MNCIEKHSDKQFKFCPDCGLKIEHKDEMEIYLEKINGYVEYHKNKFNNEYINHLNSIEIFKYMFENKLEYPSKPIVFNNKTNKFMLCEKYEESLPDNEKKYLEKFEKKTLNTYLYSQDYYHNKIKNIFFLNDYYRDSINTIIDYENKMDVPFPNDTYTPHLGNVCIMIVNLFKSCPIGDKNITKELIKTVLDKL